MTEHEQKIAEIQKEIQAVKHFGTKLIDVEDWLSDVVFLLSELEQKDIAERHLVEISGKLTYQNRMLLDYEGQQEIKQYKNNFHDAVKDLSDSLKREQKLIEGLRNIDTHIRSTHDPIPYIVQTLKGILPEYGVTE